jgi:hypothetical protein
MGLIIKKCPRCKAYGENETTRFCKNCGAELFDEIRYQGLHDTTDDKPVFSGNRWLLAIISKLKNLRERKK